MKKKIISIVSNYDSTEMFGSLFTPDVKGKALVVVFHGMAEHRHRYDDFATYLVSEGYAVLTCDHRGHGDTGEVQGYFADKEGWKHNLEDLNELIEATQDKVGDMPLYIFGHSMGSLFARSYLKRYENKVDAVALSGSPMYPGVTPLGLMMAKAIRSVKGDLYVSKLLVKMSSGAFNKTIDNPNTDFDWLSYNEENVQNYLRDPDCGFDFTVSGMIDLMSVLTDVYKKDGWSVRKVDTPIHFFSGEDDAAQGGANELAKMINYTKSLGYKSVESTVYPMMRHEILLETDHEKVQNDIAEFFYRCLMNERRII